MTYRHRRQCISFIQLKNGDFNLPIGMFDNDERGDGRRGFLIG